MASLYSTNHKPGDFPDYDDDDDEMSDDEVFVNDKKSAFDDDNGVSKPLMAPRRKVKGYKLHTEVRRGTTCKVICLPLCYAFIAIGSLIGIICLVIFLINIFAGKFGHYELRTDQTADHAIGCTHLEVDDVWVQNFPKLTTETAIRLIDVDSDETLDVIIGFGTGADGYDVPDIVCDIYFNEVKPCFGGLLALNGKTGTEIWRHYTDHEVFAVNCNEDLNGDGIKDCLAAGRAGVFQAVSGKDGALLWDFGPQEAKNDIMNIYTPQYISDQDGDGVMDIVVIHGGDPLADPGSKFRLSGRILVLSGKHGKVLQWVGVPDKKESYYSIQIHVHPDGSEIILFGTGGETHGGGLWVITVNDLLKGNIQQAKPIYLDPFKGVMTPPVMTDINSDGVEDIVMAMYNSTVIAFDGFDFHQIWNFTIPMAESYSTPAVGYFNNDDVPDFLVKYQIGPGFPIYYYSETGVLDGKDGQPIISKFLRDTVGSQASALTINVEGRGNDIFLFWTANCLGHEGEAREFTFVQGTNVHEQSRSDFCKLRFNTELVSRIYAMNQHMKLPGFIVYDSAERKSVEYNNSVNTSAIAETYLKMHPNIASYHLGNNIFQEVKNAAKTVTTDKNNYYNYPEAPDINRHRFKNKKPVHHHTFPSDRQSLSADYDDVNSYLDRTTVQQPDRYIMGKQGSRLQNPDSQLPGYYDYNLMNDEGLPMAGSHAQSSWVAKGRQGTYPENRREFYAERGRNRNSPYEMHMRYPNNGGYENTDDYNLYGVAEPYLSVGSQRVQTSNDDQDVNWESSSRYRIPYKRKLKRVKKSQRKDGNSKLRKPRHVGPHDMDGIQRLISTGTLAPILDQLASDANHSIDYIFATYWFFPAKTQAILPEDRDCIQKMMAQEQERFQPGNRYYGMDHDAYEETITKDCVERNGHSSATNRIYESQSNYDPFNIHMGQMTVYRLHLRCTCKGDLRVEKGGKRCAKMLPFQQQTWASYMGSNGDSHRVPRLKFR